MGLDRRTLLEAAGALTVTSTAGLAGCLDTVDLAGDEQAYEQWLADDGGTVAFAYADWEALDVFDEFADVDDDDLDDEELVDESDPMLAPPLLGLFVIGLGAGFGLAGTGIEGTIRTREDEDGDDRETAADFETDVTELLWVNDAFVLAGDIDVEEIDMRLTSDDDGDGPGTEYKQADEIGAYAVYERIGDDGFFDISLAADVIAVSNDSIVYASDGDDVGAREAIRRPIDAAGGDAATVTEIDDAAWLLETAGQGHVVFGGYGENEAAVEDEVDDGAVSDAVGLVASLSIDGPSSASGELAAVFETIDDDTEVDLEAELGSSAADVDVDVDDDRVTASATWDEDVTE